MKKFLQNIEKIVMGVVVLACIAWVLLEFGLLGSDTATADTATKLNETSKKLQDLLKKNVVPDTYAYSSANLKKANFDARFEEQNSRLKNVPTYTAPSYAFYPHPVRPQFEKSDKEIVSTNKDNAVMKAPEEFSVKAEHGTVFVTMRLAKPGEGIKYYNPVRIQIYRAGELIKEGEEQDPKRKPVPGKFELWNEIELAPEEDYSDVESQLGKVTAPDPKAEQPKTEDTGKVVRVQPKKEEPKESGEKVELPDQYKDLIVFKDQKDVQPNKVYFYYAVLVGRPFHLENNIYIQGHTQYVVAFPKEYELVKPKTPNLNVELRAGAKTEIASDRLPPNFILRLSATDGKVPEDLMADDAKAKMKYFGSFAVKVWVPELKDWSTPVSVRVAPGEPLNGEVRFTNPETKKPAKIAFQTGYQLKEIVSKPDRETKTVKQMVMVKVKDPATGEESDAPKKDKDGNIVYEEVQKESVLGSDGAGMTKEYAYLLNVATGKVEEFKKAVDFEVREKKFIYYDRLAKEQEARERADKERLKKLAELRKAKEDADKQKANQPLPGTPGTAPVAPGPGGQPPPTPPNGQVPQNGQPGYQMPNQKEQPKMGDNPNQPH